MVSMQRFFTSKIFTLFILSVVMVSAAGIFAVVQAQSYIDGTFLYVNGGAIVAVSPVTEGLIVEDGAVGFGTATPASALHIAEPAGSYTLDTAPSVPGVHMGEDVFGNYGIEIVPEDSAASRDAYIDFHGLSASDYDARIVYESDTDQLVVKGADMVMTGDLDITGDLDGLLDGVFTVTKYANSASDNGQANTTMVSTTDSFCFLTRVEMEDIDSDGEQAECFIREVSGMYSLRAETDDDSNVWCAATCLQW